MKPKTFARFVLVTAAVTVAALVTVAERYWSTPTVVSVQPFPKLLDRVNDVTEIDIGSADDSAVLHRTAGGWTMATKHDYPVQSEMVKQTLIGIADLRLTERKTTRPERYSRLAVEDLEQDAAAKDAAAKDQTDDEADDLPGAPKPYKARLMTLKTASGEKLAELIVGRPKVNRMGGPSGLYVRLPGDPQAWLAGAVNFEIPERTISWLEPRIIHVNGKRLSRITTIQPGGETLVLYKDKPDDPHFKFKDLPPDTKLKGESAADDLTQILMVVDLVDVAPQGDVPFPKGHAWKTVAETFDGLTVTVESVNRDDKPWSKFHAEAKDVGELPDYKGAAAAFLKPAAEVKQEAAEINARTGAWAYQIKDLQANRLRSRLAQFLEREEMPGAGGPPGMGMPNLGGGQ
ncbi:MAG: DUF4340 domain-containing protein [Alphaproteobacteria bacterium]